jgi:carboxyl-terminal processing protease
MHAVEVGGSGAEVVRLVVERRPGAQLALPLESARYSALRAARHSGRVEVRGGKRIGYLHLLYIHAGCVGLLREFAGARFADCDALVLDLRGRGGSAAEARRILRFFCGPRRVWHRPFAVLMDRGSRSAKEMLAYEFKRRAAAPIIGERSAGALVPATFREVGQGMVLMFPARRIAKYSDAVELVGVEPDIAVDHPLPYTAGADPVLQRALQHLAGSRRAARLRFPGASVRRSRPR